MLAEQAGTAARKSGRKTVGQSEIAGVLYGARCADLMWFLHGDLPRVSVQYLTRAARTHTLTHHRGRCASEVVAC